MSIKVGDKLVFRGRYNVEIIPVDRITPSGRIFAGSYQLNPNLRVRNRSDNWGGPFFGERLSDEELEELEQEEKEKRVRRNAINKIRDTRWNELPTETLVEVWKLLKLAESTK